MTAAIPHLDDAPDAETGIDPRGIVFRFAGEAALAA